MASIFTSGVFEGFDSNGDPLAGGKLYTYAAGTTTPLASYTNQGGGTPNANPVILDSAGRANVWLGSSAYRLLLKTSADVTVWDTDNVRSGGFESAALSASTGSSLVGHISTGTGAVATTVQSKLRESVSVFDFMTAAQIADVQAGTLTLDVTAAIQAAINAIYAIGGGNLYFPFGRYKITDALLIKLNVCLVGAGRRNSVIVQYTNAKNSIALERNQGIFNDIRDLGFAVNSGVTGVVHLNIGSDVGEGGVGNCNISSCNFTGGATAINIDAGYYNNIHGCYFANQTAYGVKLVGTGGANANNITGSTFNTITGDAVYIARSGGLATFQVTVNNNSFENITGNGINCPQTGTYEFSSNYFEAISGSEIIVPGAAGLIALGNYSAAGAVVVDFSSAGRGCFVVTPITASGDTKMQLGGMVFTTSGNTQIAVTNSEGSSQTLVATTTSFLGNNFRSSTYLGLTAMATGDAINNSIFVSSADNKLYFKDSTGTDRALY